MEQKGASLAGTGLSPTVEPHERLAGSAASIPSAERLLALLDENWRHLREVVPSNVRFWIAPAQKLQRRGLVEARLIVLSQGLSYRLSAQAIEARRAETQSGSVHESAVGNADAPLTPCNPQTKQEEG